MPDATDVLIAAGRDSGDPLAVRLAFELSESLAAYDRLRVGDEWRALELQLTNSLFRIEQANARYDAERRLRLAAEEQMRYWRNQATRGAVDVMLADDPEDAAYFAQAVTP